MLASYRYGDPHTARAYPLPVTAWPFSAYPTPPQLAWRKRFRHIRLEMALPACPAHHIIVPSLSLSKGVYQVSLHSGAQSWFLQSVPATAASRWRLRQQRAQGRERRRGSPSPVSTHIDCFHTEADLGPSRLCFSVLDAGAPRRYLATASIRPLHLPPPEAPRQTVLARQPEPISQMTASADIRQRICSPTALAMLLATSTDANQSRALWQGLVGHCFDPLTGAYGCWPLAIRAAASAGRIGAVEALASWEPALAVLGSGSPMVASIRFPAGALPGAPLSSTAGHLVTCYGIETDKALVMDPAAEPTSVPRRYDLAAFGRAWFGYRGAAYILASDQA